MKEDNKEFQSCNNVQPRGINSSKSARRHASHLHGRKAPGKKGSPGRSSWDHGPLNEIPSELPFVIFHGKGTNVHQDNACHFLSSSLRYFLNHPQSWGYFINNHVSYSITSATSKQLIPTPYIHQHSMDFSATLLLFWGSSNMAFYFFL